MKLTILMDNNTYIDQYYLGEPAFSVYIEDGAEKILFDTGYSDAFLRNAEQMRVDMSTLTLTEVGVGLKLEEELGGAWEKVRQEYDIFTKKAKQILTDHLIADVWQSIGAF